LAIDRKMDKHGRKVKARKGKDIYKMAGTTIIESVDEVYVVHGIEIQEHIATEGKVFVCALCAIDSHWDIWRVLCSIKDRAMDPKFFIPRAFASGDGVPLL